MAEKPTIEEARADLADVRLELGHLRNIRDSAAFLATRADVNGGYYARVAMTVAVDVLKGEGVEKLITEKYPELK